MNDRYLYRAKRTDNGEWVEGYLLYCKDCAFVTDSVQEEMEGYCNSGQIHGFGDFYKVDPSTICRCTGLKDKNGKLIWENDIVKYHFGDAYAPIRYGEYQSCFDSTSTGHIGFYVDWTGTKKENMRKDLGYWIKMIEADVVGNIFDNTELLEVK